VDLPLLLHLARGGSPPAWARADPALQPLLEIQPGARADPRARLLAGARIDPGSLLGQWTAEWRRRLPPGAGRAEIEGRLLPLLERHARSFGAPQAVDGWALRRALQERLVGVLRRALVEPAAAFAFLALEALEFERLRAELVARAAFAHWVPGA
jgi:hypothetical protein